MNSRQTSPDLDADELLDLLASRLSEPALRAKVEKLLGVSGGNGQQPIDKAIAFAREERERNKPPRGEFDDFSDVQKAYARFGATPAVHRAATAAMVNRQKALKSAGLDPQGSYLRNQRGGEALDEYVEKMRAAAELQKQQRLARAERNRPNPRAAELAAEPVATPTDTAADGPRLPIAARFQGRSSPQPSPASFDSGGRFAGEPDEERDPRLLMAALRDLFGAPMFRS